MGCNNVFWNIEWGPGFDPLFIDRIDTIFHLYDNGHGFSNNSNTVSRINRKERDKEIMEKKFKHNKKEICKICNKEIDMKKDNWAVVVDYSGKKQIATGFYHRKCLNDLLKGKTEILVNKFQDKLKTFTKGMVQGIKKGNLQDYGEQIKGRLSRLATT